MHPAAIAMPAAAPMTRFPRSDHEPGAAEQPYGAQRRRRHIEPRLRQKAPPSVQRADERRVERINEQHHRENAQGVTRCGACSKSAISGAAKANGSAMQGASAACVSSVRRRVTASCSGRLRRTARETPWMEEVTTTLFGMLAIA